MIDYSSSFLYVCKCKNIRYFMKKYKTNVIYSYVKCNFINLGYVIQVLPAFPIKERGAVPCITRVYRRGLRSFSSTLLSAFVRVEAAKWPSTENKREFYLFYKKLQFIEIYITCIIYHTLNIWIPKRTTIFCEKKILLS